MSKATLKAAPKKGGDTVISEKKLRGAVKVIEVEAIDGTVIPVPAHFANSNAQVRVDGDGSCVANQRHQYLVTVLNGKSDPAAEAKRALSAIGGEIVDNIKDELLKAGLKALKQGKVVQYALKGLEVVGSAPVTIVKALLFDATATGQAPEGYIYVKLDDGSVAAIRWIG